MRFALIIEALRLVYFTKHPKTVLKVSKTFYEHFTKPHKKLPFIKNKQFPCLLKINTFAEYYKSVSGKNSPAYFARKARKAGYRVLEFDRNCYLSEIDEINQSKPFRQGKQMTASYRNPVREYYSDAVGVFLNGKLVGYIEYENNGYVLIISKILGHADHLKHGIMYYLLLSFIAVRWHYSDFIMYDTLLFNSDGMKLFKKRFKFKTWEVKWELLNR